MRAIVSVLAVLCVIWPLSGRAQSREMPAPSLEVSTDAPVPYYKGALSLELTSLVVLRGALGLELALSRVHSISVAASVAYSPSMQGSLELGYHVWPLGSGLRGLWLGPALAVDYPSMRSLLAFDAGWQLVAAGWVINFGAGIGCARNALDEGNDTSLAPRVRVAIGYAWR